MANRTSLGSGLTKKSDAPSLLQHALTTGGYGLATGASLGALIALKRLLWNAPMSERANARSLAGRIKPIIVDLDGNEKNADDWSEFLQRYMEPGARAAVGFGAAVPSTILGYKLVDKLNRMIDKSRLKADLEEATEDYRKALSEQFKTHKVASTLRGEDEIGKKLQELAKSASLDIKSGIQSLLENYTPDALKIAYGLWGAGSGLGAALLAHNAAVDKKQEDFKKSRAAYFAENPEEAEDDWGSVVPEIYARIPAKKNI
jgi:hypothetical protein